MTQCHTCGNHYDKCLQVIMAEKLYLFDCFECAVHALAPACNHCGCKIIGHGMEQNGNYYCCSHCVKAQNS